MSIHRPKALTTARSPGHLKSSQAAAYKRGGRSLVAAKELKIEVTIMRVYGGYLYSGI